MSKYLFYLNCQKQTNKLAQLVKFTPIFFSFDKAVLNNRDNPLKVLSVKAVTNVLAGFELTSEEQSHDYKFIVLTSRSRFPSTQRPGP